VGVEPTGDGIARRPPVLKTGTITGPHALPQGNKKKTTDRQSAADRTAVGFIRSVILRAIRG
jgi:hypothetical protein